MLRRPLGNTGLSVTPLCVGTSPLGSSPGLYGYEVDTQQAIDTVCRAIEGPINFIDTSNNYGNGESERRIGQAIDRAGGLPADFVLATKVDPLPGSADFSGARVRASVEESIQRLNQDHLQLVYLHDPERIPFSEATGPDGAVEALVELQHEGVIGFLGVACGPLDLAQQYVDLGVFDVVLSHNRYTLVDATAEPLIANAARRGMAFVNAAPYGGGMLVRGPKAEPNYCYQPASPATLARVARMEEICREAAIPLAAAALQFSILDSRIASTVVGISHPERIEQTLRLADWSIPDDVWSALRSLHAQGPDRDVSGR